MAFLTFCRSSISVPLSEKTTLPKVPSALIILPGPACPSHYSQQVLSEMWATKSGPICETCGIAHVGTSDDKRTSKIRTIVLACWLLEDFEAATNHRLPLGWSLWVTTCASRELINSQDVWGRCSMCKACLILSANQAIFTHKVLCENDKSMGELKDCEI